VEWLSLAARWMAGTEARSTENFFFSDFFQEAAGSGATAAGKDPQGGMRCAFPPYRSARQRIIAA